MHFLSPDRGRRFDAAPRRTCVAAAVAVAAAGVSVVATTDATAAEPTWSIGAGGGIDRGRVECLPGFACDRNGTAWKLFGGTRIADAVELQATVFDAGRFKGADTAPLGTEFGGEFKVRGLALTAGYRWPLASAWSVAAHGGIAAVRARFEYANDAWGATKKTTAQPYASVGVAYAVTPAVRIGVDYDVTRFKAYRDRGSLQMLGVSARFAF